MISVITPAYNREYILTKAYKSLLSQIDKDFEWIVVDDGSIDNTENLVKKFIEENKIKITYYKKDNGGKHTALNYGIQKAIGDLVLILDSDDYLEENAIKLAKQYWDKYKNNKNISGISFLRNIQNPTYKDKKFIECIANPIEFKYNSNYLSDMCEVFRVDILKQYPFPIFKEEKFLSEAIVWNKIAFDYDMVYIPIGIYNTEYLNDGLSKNWLKLVINNPLGAKANCLLFMNKRFKFSIRLKNCIMFNIFSMISKENILKETPMKIWSIIFYLPCIIVSKILFSKYKK